MNGPAFRVRVERLRAPIPRPGDVVALDNLPAHRVPGVQAIVERAGKELRLLPPCSPDLSPIEMTFAKLKACFRHAAAHTLGALVGRHRPGSRDLHRSRMPKLLPGRRV